MQAHIPIAGRFGSLTFFTGKPERANALGIRLCFRAVFVSVSTATKFPRAPSPYRERSPAPRTGIMQTRTKYSCSRGFPRDSLPVVILCETVPEARSCIIHASASTGVTSARVKRARSAGLPGSSGSDYSFRHGVCDFLIYLLVT